MDQNPEAQDVLAEENILLCEELANEAPVVEEGATVEALLSVDSEV